MHSLKRIFKEQQGVTLTELMVAIAILGGIALITAKLMDDQLDQQNHIKTMAEISQTMTRLESHLNNPDQCGQMLLNKRIGNNVGVSGTIDASLMKTDQVNGITVLREGNFNFFRIPDNGVRIENSVYGSSVADVVISFIPTKDTAFARGRGTITQRLPIVVQTNATGDITSCGPVLGDSNLTAQKQLCDTLRGTNDPDPTKGFVRWDTTENRCKLNGFSCPFGQVVTRINSLGSVVCESLQGQVKVEDLFDFNLLNCSSKIPLNLRIINENGKFKVTCF